MTHNVFQRLFAPYINRGGQMTPEGIDQVVKIDLSFLQGRAFVERYIADGVRMNSCNVSMDERV